MEVAEGGAGVGVVGRGGRSGDVVILDAADGVVDGRADWGLREKKDRCGVAGAGFSFALSATVSDVGLDRGNAQDGTNPVVGLRVSFSAPSGTSDRVISRK